MQPLNRIIHGDALETLRILPSNLVDCIITSPPYFALRNYGVDGQIGLESSPDLYIENILAVFAELKRVLKPAGTAWLNLGDSYVSARSRRTGTTQRISGGKYRGEVLENRPDIKGHPVLKNKDLALVPQRIAIALQEQGWYVRSDIIWAKPNPMPESVKDRPTKSHEYIFMLTKCEKYFYDIDTVRQPHKENSQKRIKNAWNGNRNVGSIPGSFSNMEIARMLHPLGRNLRTVWNVPVSSFKGAHFATFPEKLIEPCVLAGCPENGVILDPFMGAGTTAVVAKKLGRDYLGIELNSEYISIANNRVNAVCI